MKKFCFLLVLMGCGMMNVWGQKKKEITVPVGVTYMLPRVAFDVEIVMERADYIPGPFRHYAEQQLGVKPDIQVAGTEWEVKSIRLEPRAVPEKKGVYTVTASGEYRGICFTLTPEGFLAGVGSRSSVVPEEQELLCTLSGKNKPSSINYVHFGIRPTQKEVLDSNFTMMEVEGEMQRVWDPIERYELKTEKDYVKEITNEIFNIRKKRLEMLAGEHASGQATQAALDELRTLEEHYMSLFMGKVVRRKVVERLVYIPEKGRTSTTLFRFSKANGLMSKSNVAAEPYIVEIRNVVIPGETAQPDGAVERTGMGITYRVPAVADLVLMTGNQLLMKKQCVIPQLGYLKEFPLEVINGEGLSIEFYPQYGSVKSIIKN